MAIIHKLLTFRFFNKKIIKQNKQLNNEQRKEMNWIKKLLDLKDEKQCDVHVVSKRFCIKYVIDGNLALEYSFFCDATCEEMARYNFWDNHNELYHDIISVNVC